MPGQRVPEDERRISILQAAYRVAARDRLTGVTGRRVAAEAGVSSGLVFFYFENKDVLLLSLLDWMLDTTLVAQLDSPDAPGLAREGMLDVLERDVERLRSQRDRVELFFDYWVMGTRHPEIRGKIRRALERYREMYLPFAEEVIAAEPDRYRAVSAEALAAVATGFIEGCALQIVMDPERFAVEDYMSTLRALIERPVSAGV